MQFSFRRLGLPVFFLCATSFMNTASASIIDFEGTDSTFNPIASDGFQFNFNAAGWAISPNTFGLNSNGTSRLVADGDRNGVASVTMTALDSHSFSLGQLDAAAVVPGYSSGGMLITGYLTAGGIVTQNLSLTDIFQTFAIDPSFTGLSSVMFSDTASGAFQATPGIGLDNIVVDAAATPEPSAFLLAGAGLAVLALRRRV